MATPKKLNNGYLDECVELVLSDWEKYSVHFLGLQPVCRHSLPKKAQSL